MTPLATGRTTGALLLLAFVLYGGGTALVTAATADPATVADVATRGTQVSWGVLLVLLNSVAVAAIGVVVLPIVRPHSEVTAVAYLVTRTVEAVLLAVGALGLMLVVPLARDAAGRASGEDLVGLALAANDHAYTVAMAALGLGSIAFCRVLLRARLVPRGLAVWGIAGYVAVVVGMVLELVGHGPGLVVWLPGGLFEVALAVLLLVRGFPSAAESRPTNVPPAQGPARLLWNPAG